MGSTENAAGCGKGEDRQRGTGATEKGVAGESAEVIVGRVAQNNGKGGSTRGRCKI